MTPRSDHDEDMSMEEILASIRRFVTDNPSEDIHAQKTDRGTLREPLQEFSRVPPVKQRQATEQPASHPAYQQPQIRQHPYENRPEAGADILELSEPYTPSVETIRAGSWPGENLESSPANQGMAEYQPDGHASEAGMARPLSSHNIHPEQDPTILTLTNPIEPGRKEKPVSVQLPPKNSGEAEETIGSAHTVVSSAGSLARLVQTAKSVPAHKAASSVSSARNMTLDQLIQDMIRPMIKQWIDTNLPSLVEEMVAKEIRRITQHLD